MQVNSTMLIKGWNYNSHVQFNIGIMRYLKCFFKSIKLIPLIMFQKNGIMFQIKGLLFFALFKMFQSLNDLY